MRPLFDQNLSFKLCQMITDLFPDSSHVRSHGLSEAADRALWEFAKANGFAIVTQDADLAELAPAGFSAEGDLAPGWQSNDRGDSRPASPTRADNSVL